jgi:PAS domain S-box-containing protein/putative nucleotidyltransferase with HDIG domain
MAKKIIKTLIIEDNPADVLLIRRMLSEAMTDVTFELESCDMLKSGLKRISEGGINIVLLDLGLPDCHGFEVFLRVHEQGPDLPIVVLTGLDDEEFAVKAVQMGAQDYLVKGQIYNNLLKNSLRYAIERKRVEEALRESEEKYRLIFETAANLITIVDQEGVIVDCNSTSRDVLSYNKDEMVGQPIRKIMHPDYRAKGKKLILETLAEGCIYNQEYKMVRKDKEIIDVRINSAKINWKRGKHLYIVYIIEDITDRKRAEEQLVQSFRKLEVAMEGTICIIDRIVEARDPYTAGHQRRVAILACAIAREMRFPEDQIKGLHVASGIHDIGKIQVPAEILSKPGRISDDEFNIIKSHSKVGYDILKSTEFPWPVAQIVLQHHERINGSGYPGGLLGKDILQEAKILGVADVFEAMTSHRPYRPALGADKALYELAQNRNILYDPKVADACIKLVNKKGFNFEEKNSSRQIIYSIKI